MRPFWIAIPASLALACGGLALLTAAKAPHVETVDISDAEPIHPVTTAMVKETSGKARKVAPAFVLKDVQGKTVTFGSPGATKPQFIYFALDGCPCSFNAEPLFQDLYKHLKGSVDFITITDAKADHAKRWWQQMTVPYPVVSDPKLEVIKAYGATNAVFSALVSKDGHIVKMWPGYSVKTLGEMNRMLSAEAGIPVKPFDTKYAPKAETSGCAFPVD